MDLVTNKIGRDSNFLAKKTFVFLGRLCLIIAPLLSFIGWAIPHDSLSSFMQFNFIRETSDGTATIDRENASAVFRYYLLPHYFIYASMTFYAGAGIYSAYLSYRKSPWHALIGGILVVIGAIYFVGVLGAFLSIPIGTVNQTNILKISFVLSAFVFLGNLVLGIGLYRASLLPMNYAIIFIMGITLIVVFPGVENWMALGSLLMLIGSIPLLKV